MATYVVKHPKFYRSVNGKLTHVEAGTRINMTSEAARPLLANKRIEKENNRPVLDDDPGGESGGESGGKLSSKPGGKSGGK